MAYSTSDRTFTFGRNHQLFVAPLLDLIPVSPEEPPLSFLVAKQDANRCAYAWRNYFNYMNVKRHYRVSIVEVPQSPTEKAIQIDFLATQPSPALPSRAVKAPAKHAFTTAPPAGDPPGAGDTFLPDGKAPEFTTKKFWEDAIQEVLQADACPDADTTSPTTECRSPFDPATKK